MEKGKFQRKSQKGINHRVKYFKAEIGKKMPCRNGVIKKPDWKEIATERQW